MTLHDRLKPVPFDEVEPARRGWHAVAVGVVLSVFAAGFALAMPYAARRAHVTPTSGVAVDPSPSASTPLTLPDVAQEDPQDEAEGNAEPRGPKPKVHKAKPRKSRGARARNLDPGARRGGARGSQKKPSSNDAVAENDDDDEDLPAAEDKNGKAPPHAGGPDDPDDDPGRSGRDHDEKDRSNKP